MTNLFKIIISLLILFGIYFLIQEHLSHKIVEPFEYDKIVK